MTEQTTVTTVADGIARISWPAGQPVDVVRHEVAAALVEHARVEALVDPEDEGAQRIATWSGLRREGVMRGVPDLFVPAWGLWIEMKRTKGGVVSVEQADWIEYLQGLGYAAVVCRGCDEAKVVSEKHRREVVSRWRV